MTDAKDWFADLNTIAPEPRRAPTIPVVEYLGGFEADPADVTAGINRVVDLLSVLVSGVEVKVATRLVRDVRVDNATREWRDVAAHIEGLSDEARIVVVVRP